MSSCMALFTSVVRPFSAALLNLMTGLLRILSATALVSSSTTCSWRGVKSFDNLMAFSNSRRRVLSASL